MLGGYRTVTGGYGSEHSDVRSMNQNGVYGIIPLHFLTRRTTSLLSEFRMSELQINTRRPGDGWLAHLGASIISREKPGLKPEIGFVCDGEVSDFTSTITRPEFALPKEPANYDIDLNNFASNDIVYLTVPEISPDIDLTQSWVMFSNIEDAELDDASWRMVPLSGVGVTQSNRQIYFDVSALGSVAPDDNFIASVRLSLKDTASESTMYVSDIGIRKHDASWNPMEINTRFDSLSRASAEIGGGILGELPVSQPQMIWANDDNSRISVLGGAFVADFNTGSLPYSEPSAIRFHGGDVVIKPVVDPELVHEISANFSISCWVRFTEESFSSSRPMGIAAKYVEPIDEETNAYDPEAGHGSYRFAVTPDGEVLFQLGLETYTTSGAGISAGEWHYIVVTRDSDQLKVYLDAELVETFAVSSSVDEDPTAPFSIGAWSVS